MANKNRADLKSYFVKNAIPTEGNFADLVDSQLNQTEDGVFKLPGEPLAVVAATGDQKRTLRLYADYPANPDWFISLNPAQNPADPATNRAGFGVTDATGRTRLFIDKTTGNLGVGTNNPQAPLHVAGNLRVNGAVTAGSVTVNGPLRANERLQVAGDRIVNSSGLSLLETNAVDWLRVNPDSLYPSIALYNPVAIGTGGLAVGSWETLPAGQLRATGSITCGNSDLYFSNTNHAHTGTGNQDGWAAIENASDFGALMILGRQTSGGRIVKLWDRLEVNGYALVAGTLEANTLYARGNAGVLNLEGSNHAYMQWYPQGSAAGRKGWIGYGGAGTNILSVSNDAGPVSIPSGALCRDIGVGTQIHGATVAPYETIQMNPIHNLRISFGTRERFVLCNDGTLQIKFDQGSWVFQPDGNLVKYRSDGVALWALNKVSGNPGW